MRAKGELDEQHDRKGKHAQHDDFGRGAEVREHDGQGDHDSEQPRVEPQRDPVQQHVGARRVVQDAVDAVADPQVVQSRHRQRPELPGYPGSQEVVHRLREPKVHPEVEKPQDARHQAGTHVRQVLRLRGDVVALGQGAVTLRREGRGAAGRPRRRPRGRSAGRPARAPARGEAEDRHHEHAEQEHPEHHLDRTHAVQQQHRRRQVGRETRSVADRRAQDDVVDDDLARPGRDHQAEDQLHRDEAELRRDPRLEQPKGRDDPREDTQDLPERDVRAQVEDAGGTVELLLAFPKRRPRRPGCFGHQPASAARLDSLASVSTNDL